MRKFVHLLAPLARSVAMAKSFFAVLTLALALAASLSSFAVAQPMLDPTGGSDGGVTGNIWDADPVIGSIDAPVVVVEYASWTCPHCARFHEQVVGPIIKPLVDEGIVRFVPRDLLRNWIDLRVGMVTRCEGVDFYAASDALFANQADYSVNDPAQVDAAIIALLDMDPARYAECSTDTAMAEWLVARTQEAPALGVSGTPSVFINGEPMDLSMMAQMESLVREAAAVAAAASAATNDADAMDAETSEGS